MEYLIRQSWWKILGVVLLLYTVIMGLFIPLSPGIMEVAPVELKPGINKDIHIAGYNTRFQQAESSMQVWLMTDSQNICASNFIVKNDRHLVATFNIPGSSGRQVTHLLINNDLDGTIIMTEAFGLKFDPTDDKLADCKITVKEDEANYLGFPFKDILQESIRNLFFHVPMWFSMIIVLTFSMVFSIRYLRNNKRSEDLRAASTATVGMFLGILGIVTGMEWAQFTWREWWSGDPKQNASAIALLIYLAYFVLRSSIDDMDKRARVGAVYNIFAFSTLIPLLFILPRLTESLHPGSGGNPGFNAYDLDSTMRLVFYPAVIGWILISLWIATLHYRVSTLRGYFLEKMQSH